MAIFTKEHVIYNPLTDTINGVPAIELELKLQHIVPDGYSAVCHYCKPPKALKENEARTHDLEVHGIKR